MQKRCQECMKNAVKFNLPIDSPDLPRHEGCLRNHDRTSKSMEALACVKGLEEIYNETGVAVRGIVRDDDSSFRANIRHCWKDKISSDLYPNFTEKDHPKCLVESGKKKGQYVKQKDYGRLPLTVPEVVDDYCDPNHRVRVWGSTLFALAKQPVTKNFGLKNEDCERMKINFSYFLVLYKDLPIQRENIMVRL